MKSSCIPLNPQAPPCQASHQILMHWGGAREPIPGSLLFGPFPYSSGGAFSGKSGGMFGSLFLVVASLVIFPIPQASH